MDERIYLNFLYDYYGELLSEKEQKYFEDYYFNNLSLSEISENMQISRNLVHRSLKKIEEKLNFYEEKLGLYEKSKKLEEIISKCKDEKLKRELENLN